MVHYVAVSCSSDTRGKDKVSFFRLPKGTGNLKKIWLQKTFCHENDKRKEENIRLCHLHFEDECFERYLKVRSSILLYLVCLRGSNNNIQTF